MTTSHTIESALSSIVFHRTAAPGAYTVETPAGPAIIERYRVDGPYGGAHWAYQVQTSFTGDRIRFHLGYVTYKVARRGVALLVANHLNENRTHA